MPAIVFMCTLLLICVGAAAYVRLDVEAYPNPVPPLVETIVQPVGWSPEEVERLITIPLEVGLSGMPGLTHVRSQSLFGLSDVKCYFSWDTPYTVARQEVINRYSMVQLPNNNVPSLSPWNAIGEVFRYTIDGEGYSLIDKKAQEDWVLERQWHQVPGVVDVTSYGGLSKEYHVDVDPFRLRGHGVSLNQLTSALANANTNVGGDRLRLGEQVFDVRGIGLIGALGTPLADIENTVVAEQKGTPVHVRDVANTSIGHAPRMGMVGHDNDDDVVQGIVLMRYGGETPSTLAGVHKRLEYIEKNNILPPGMKIVPYYDRGNLVDLTMHTVLENMFVGMGLVLLTLMLFLSNVRQTSIRFATFVN